MPDALSHILTVIAWGIGGLLPLLGGCLLVFWLVNMPLRRQENARFFLDLMRVGLKSGRSPEQALVELSRTGDRDLSGRFHLVASFLQSGATLLEALERAPRLLPPQILALLKIGRKLGDFQRILPAAGAMLQDGPAGARKSKDYLVLLAFVVTPVTIVYLAGIQLFVLPKFEMISVEILGETDPGWWPLMYLSNWIWVAGQLFVLATVWIAVLFYFINPRCSSWEDTSIANWLSRLRFRIPWIRNRMKRDFSTALALLLDAGIPEAEAVTLAAECGANLHFLRRARVCARRLQEGVSLSDALRTLDASGQFAWRLDFVDCADASFERALQGWREELDTAAFQQEQAFTQAFTSGLVLWNGATVGLIAFAVVDFLRRAIMNPALW